MSILVAEQELYQSCQILFGNELLVGRDFLNYLQPSGLKKAYRLKARQTHPDLCANADSEAGSAAGQPDFVSVQQAYENLRGFLVHRDRGFQFSTPPPPPPGRSAGGPAFHQATGQANRSEAGPAQGSRGPAAPNLHSGLYRGPLPPIRLRLGHFFYYSGLIDWLTIVRALVWQRNQRPRLGELATRLGWLSPEEIRELLSDRLAGERLGSSAVRRQKLSEKQLAVLLDYQRLLQKKFGAFFLEQRIFTPEQLADLLRRQTAHNSIYTGPGGL